jgi:hypothetical protein
MLEKVLTLDAAKVSRVKNDVLMFDNQGYGAGLAQPALTVVVEYISR